MKRFYLSLCCCLFAGFVFGQTAIISEFASDPTMNDGTGGEFIELYCPAGGGACDISCWVVSDGQGLITIPDGTSIPDGGYFLIAYAPAFNCATCDFNGLPVDLDLATCGCLNGGSYSGAADGGQTIVLGKSGNTGELVLLFDASGTISDQVAFDAGQNTQFPNASITGTPVGTCAGGSYGIPDPATVSPDAGPIVKGCNTSYSYDPVAMAWSTDNHPTPGVENDLTDADAFVFEYSIDGAPFVSVADGATVDLCGPATNITIRGTVNNHQNVLETVFDFAGKYGSYINDPNNGGIQAWTTFAGQGSGVTTFEYTTALVTGTTYAAQWSDYKEGCCGSTSPTSGNECYERVEFTINVIEPLATAALACADDNAGLNAVTADPATAPGVTYTLYDDANDQSNPISSNTTGLFTIAAPAATGYYVIVSQAGGCAPDVTVTGTFCVAIPPCPEVAAGDINGVAGPVALCPDEEFNLQIDGASADNLNLPNGGTIDWYFDESAAFDPWTGGGTLLGQADITLNSAKDCSTLAPGDLVITAIQSDNPDVLCFVPLVDLQPSTSFFITDNGWLAAGGFRGTGEGTMEWIAPAAGVTAGTEVCLSGFNATTPAPTATVGSIAITGDGVPSLSTGGDQMIFYCASAWDATPSVFAAIHTDANVWSADATDSNTSAIPTGLTEGISAAAVGNTATGDYDNAVFNCTGGTVSGDAATIAAIVMDNSNWTGSTSIIAPTPSTCAFTVTGASSSYTIDTLTSAFTNADCGKTYFIKGIVQPFPSAADNPACLTADATTATFEVSLTCPTADLDVTPIEACDVDAPVDMIISTDIADGTMVDVNYDNNGTAGTAAGLTVTGGQIVVPVSMSGTYTLTGVIPAAGCAAAVTGMVDVVITPTPTVAPTIPATLDVCEGEAALLTASGGSTFEWSLDNFTSVDATGEDYNVPSPGAAGATTTVYVRSVNTPPATGCPGPVAQVTITSIACAGAPVGSISGNVFIDNYADGTNGNNDGMGAGMDSPLAGAMVELYDCSGTLIQGPYMVDAMGNYSFPGLPDGCYYVQFIPPVGTPAYTGTFPNVGSSTADDSDMNGSNQSPQITIVSAAGTSDGDDTFAGATDYTDVDAGFFQPVVIEGVVYEDTDDDGSADAPYTGADATITATFAGPDGMCGGADDIAVPTTSAADGSYMIMAPPGILCDIVFTVPGGNVPIGPPSGNTQQPGETSINGSDSNPPGGTSGTSGLFPSGSSSDMNNFALPIELLYFKATRIGDDQARLEWATSTEINTSHFVIERSTDGFNFSAIGTASAAGNSSSEQFYTAFDNSPSRGVNYYRLKMIDLDETFVYSPTRTVLFNSVGGVTVVPNPVQNAFILTLENPVSAPTRVELIGANGALAREGYIIEGENLLRIDISDLAAGSYFIRVDLGNEVISEQVIKID